MTLNFKLAELEAHLPDLDRLEGERLLEREALSKPVETERHLWTARVAGHEPEVQISPSRVRALSCDCAVFAERKSCAHVAALLLQVRADRPAPKPKSTKPTGPKRLSVPAILEAASAADLQNFLLQYAKQDKAFALALKARFASSVRLADNREKYRRLIDGTVRAARKPGGGYSPRGIKKVLPVLQELLAQADDAAARAVFTDATDILQAFIPRIGQLVAIAPDMTDELRLLVLAAFARLDQLLDRFPAPALRNALWDFGIGELGKNFYRRAELLEPLFALLMRLADEGQKRTELLEVLDAQLERPFAIPAQRTALLMVKLDLLRRDGASDAVERLLLENLDTPKLLTAVVRAELERGEPEAACALGEAGRKQLRDRWAVNALDELLLEAGEALKDEKLIEQYGSSRFLTSFNFTYYDRMGEYLTDPAWRTRLENTLLAGEASARRTQATATWFMRTQQPDRLLQLLRKRPDLDVLLAHADALYAYSPKEAIDLLLSMSRAYLNRHLGIVPARRMTEVLRRLRRKGLPEVADRLADRLAKEYPARKALLEALREW